MSFLRFQNYLPFVILLVITSFIPAISQWSYSPTTNNPICSVPTNQSSPTMTSDGNGGAIITWEDARNGYKDIYVQKINAKGVVQWNLQGVALCTASNNQNSPMITNDNAGGAIVTWYDYRSSSNYDIYAQRINADGVVQWRADGVPLCTETSNQYLPSITSDNLGGAIVTWYDIRNGLNYDIYAQRINSAGVVQWTTNGVPLCRATGDQQAPTITSDNAGGAIVAWSDNRDGGGDIYAQRINSSGVIQWTIDGVALCTATNFQSFPIITTDGTGGAIVAWADSRSGTGYDIYAQKINAAGYNQWFADGEPISVAPENQEKPSITNDNAGGAIISWVDTRMGTFRIYAQKINNSGLVQWTTDGIPICQAVGMQQYPTITSDRLGGAIITWNDFRNSGNSDIYSQRISSDGTLQWTSFGAPICTADNDNHFPIIISDNAGGAIVTWIDYRNGTNNDIYAQNIDRNGYLGDASPHIQGVLDVKNDQGGKIKLMWNRSYVDTWPQQTIFSYFIWRGVKPSSALSDIPVYDPRSTALAQMAKKREKYYIKFPITSSSSDTIYWEYIAEVSSHWEIGYSYTASTLSDSGSQGNSMNYFMVTALTSENTIYWNSEPDSGYSVDNLSPSAVLGVNVATQSPTSLNIHWKKNTTDPDVKLYEIHRSPTDGFIPDQSTKIGQTTDTEFVDQLLPAAPDNYYRIITVDVHGNKSAPSAQASISPGHTALLSVSDKWNLVSVPLTVNDYSKALLYPTSISSAFAYSNGYIINTTLSNGKAYWLKFNGSQSVRMSGITRSTEIIPLEKGWNLIGSISTPIDVTTITSIPSGLITSQFYGYENGYVASATIEPGKGYWVKVTEPGEIMLNSSFAKSSQQSAINIVPTSELPPSPPYEQNANPISQIPNQFALEQNYPNPFNPTTTITYQIPDVGTRRAVSSPATVSVTLKVYNTLGEEVATLVNEIQDAGFKSVTFDASKLPSGVYTYRLQAGNFTNTKKLLLMK